MVTRRSACRCTARHRPGPGSSGCTSRSGAVPPSTKLTWSKQSRRRPLPWRSRCLAGRAAPAAPCRPLAWKTWLHCGMSSPSVVQKVPAACSACAAVRHACPAAGVVAVARDVAAVTARSWHARPVVDRPAAAQHGSSRAQYCWTKPDAPLPLLRAARDAHHRGARHPQARQSAIAGRDGAPLPFIAPPIGYIARPPSTSMVRPLK